MADVGKFVIVETLDGSILNCFSRHVLIPLSIKFFGYEFFSKYFLMVLTSRWNKHELLQILKAQWIKVSTRPIL